MNTRQLDRFEGALLGLAAGDALGTTLEFKRRGTFPPLDTIVGGGPFNLRPGQWTDDTSMAMCLAESLVEKNGFDPLDQMQRYVRWWREGHWSSTGKCFDIGNTTAQALATFERNGDPLAGQTDPQSAGNGSLMRLAPVPLRYAHDATVAVQLAGESSQTTHGATEAVDACRYFAALTVGALRGVGKDELLGPLYAPDGVDWNAAPLSSRIAAVAKGSFKTKPEAEIESSGYVVHTLEAALWAFYTTSDFRGGALAAVNLGHDSDTTGAVYGQLAGVYYGAAGIPAEWRAVIARAQDISALATQLYLRADRG